jgi:HlyD family secretion protein
MNSSILPTWCLCALGITAFLAGCGESPPDTETQTKAALTVELVSPVASDWPEWIEAVGSIAPWQESVIGAEVGDLRIEEVLVDVGDVVTKGQLLARFKGDTPAADLSMAQAAVAQWEASAALAHDKAIRARRLGSVGTISQEDLLQYESDEKTTAAQLASAKAQLQIQQLRVFHVEVRAPDDGVISSRSATVGTVANLGTELFRMIRQGRLEWRAAVPSDHVARITPRQPVTLTPDRDSAITGVVRQVSPVVDSGTLNGTVYVDLHDPRGLRAGMFISGKLLFPVRPALHVPESALVFRDGYQYLMKVEVTNRVRQIKVTTGRRTDQAVEILGSGVTTTDRIVRSGGSFLNEGDHVRVVSAAPVVMDASDTQTAKQGAQR